MPTVGAPGTGIGSAVYVVLTIGAAVQRIFRSVRAELGIDTTQVAIPFWLFSQDSRRMRRNSVRL